MAVTPFLMVLERGWPTRLQVAILLRRVIPVSGEPSPMRVKPKASSGRAIQPKRRSRSPTNPNLVRDLALRKCFVPALSCFLDSWYRCINSPQHHRRVDKCKTCDERVAEDGLQEDRGHTVPYRARGRVASDQTCNHCPGQRSRFSPWLIAYRGVCSGSAVVSVIVHIRARYVRLRCACIYQCFQSCDSDHRLRAHSRGEKLDGILPGPNENQAIASVA